MEDDLAYGVRIEVVKRQLVFMGRFPAGKPDALGYGAFAEVERSLVGESQREGVTLAKRVGSTADAGSTRAGKAGELRQRPVRGE